MGNVFEELMTESEAKGKAEGEAQGIIAEIRRLVAKGRLTVDAARAEIEDLIATKAIPEALGREALGLLSSLQAAHGGAPKARYGGGQPPDKHELGTAKPTLPAQPEPRAAGKFFGS